MFLFVAALSGFAGENDTGAVDQRDYADSANGCGPATILNLLKRGGDGFSPALDSLVGANDGVKMRFLVERYFKNRPSGTYPGQQRWGVHGIDCRDLALGLNELMTGNGLSTLASTYLDRSAGESGEDHLHRCSDLMARSLNEGVPPILSIRSYVVKWREENGSRPRWEPGFHHYVLVTGVIGQTGSAVTGIELEILDPLGAKTPVAYLHRNPSGQPFRALKGTLETGNWLDGEPFLHLVAPEVKSVRVGNLDWSERFIVVANFLVGRF